MEKLVILLGISVIATVIGVGFGSQYGDYGDQARYEEDQYDSQLYKPSFTATPQVFTVQVDDTITFPCDVENLGTNQLLFRHTSLNGDQKLIYVGDTLLQAKAYKFTRTDNSYELSGVERRHAGKYECRIETNTDIKELVHTLNVQYPAKVRRISPDKQTVTKGSSVTLECEGIGNPKAAISWSKQTGKLPSGAQSVEGVSLTLDNVNRYVEGTYICTASNGVGLPSSTQMTIEVEYEPEIVAEQAMLHTGEGKNAELVCIVHGRPSPSVTWKKNGEFLRDDDHLQEHDGLHRHILTVTNIQEDDFGEYTCVAQNRIGTREETLRLTGLPRPPRMTSSPAGGERDAYTITWETESHSPIIQYRLRYRKTTSNSSTNYPGGWDDKLHNAPPSQAPEDHLGAGYLSGDYLTHHMSQPIRDLEPATDYEATVAVENKFGWSLNSDLFRFYTRKEDPTTTTTSTTTTTTTTTLAPEPENIAPLLEEVAVGQSASGSERRMLSTVLLMMVMGVFVF